MAVFQMFLDLNSENIIDVANITKGNLIGRGAFGFVFKAALRNSDDGKVKSAAMKMLQPVQPGLRTGKVLLKADFSLIDLAKACRSFHRVPY